MGIIEGIIEKGSFNGVKKTRLKTCQLKIN